VKLVIIEDQLMFRETLSDFLNRQNDIEVVGGSGSAIDAFALCERYQPDLILLDVCTEENASGIKAAGELREAYPDLKIVIMTAMPEITYLEQAHRAGANGFIYKSIHSEQLLATIRSVLDGYDIFPRKTPTDLPVEFHFTEREMKVLRLVCDAKDRKEIAAELFMSESSVKACITDILNNTGYDSILKFAVFAISNGYINPALK
jgi:DNA-binding NarL/FixJ family response regulator